MYRLAQVQDTSLYPAIYRSKGLLQAHFDCIGGAPEEYNSAGTNNNTVAIAMDNQLLVPKALGGGGISWMRGVWMPDVVFRYNGFMSDISPLMSLPHAINYLAASQPDLNNWRFSSRGQVTITSVNELGAITGVSVTAPGLWYEVGTIIPVNGGNQRALLNVISVGSNGELLGVSIRNAGAGYATGVANCRPVVNLPTHTVVTLAHAVPDGTQLQLYYTYQDGTKIERGAGLSGYPNRRSSARENDWGTANDGDLYIANALYYAHAATGLPQYKKLADHLLTAQVQRSFGLGQIVPFDMPLMSQTGAAGLYEFYGNGSPWFWDVEEIPNTVGLRGLHIRTNVFAEGPPYSYAGWGMWPAWPVTPISPFQGYSFDFVGNGKGGGIQLSTNVFQPATPDGEYVYGFCCLAADAGQLRHFDVSLDGFWNMANVVYNQDRSATYKGAASSDDSATLQVLEVDDISPSGQHQFKVARCGGSLTATWANYFFGSNNEGFDSAGTSYLRVDIVTDICTAIDFTITDANDVSHSYTYFPGLPVEPINKSFLLPYALFDNGAIAHPIKQVSLQPAHPETVLLVNNIICGDLITLANPPSPIELLGGFQFGFGLGEFDVYFKNCKIHQVATDPYPGISRYTYGVNKSGKWYGAGSWQGQIAVGYMWMLAYALSDIRYPANSIARYADGTSFDYSGLPVIYCMRKFMEDSQQKFHADFPSKPLGPMYANYGAWAWEFVKGYGNIGGTLAPNNDHPLGVLNQFYFAKDGSIGSGGEVDPPADGSWPGYETRAILSCAEDYFVTGDETSLRCLDNWFGLFAATATWDAGNKIARFPVNIWGDGSANLSNSLYTLTCVGEAMLYKYWRDGDTLAATWLPRILEDLHTNFKITESGKLYDVFPAQEGQDYTQATCVVTGDGVGAVVSPVMAGGRITHYEVVDRGSGYTNISVQVLGNGTGAQATPSLSQKYHGAYNREHTGWEIAEVGKFFGMLKYPPAELGPINHSYTNPGALDQDFDDLWAFYQRNTGWQRPSILQGDMYPLHEFTWSSFHWNCSVEDPVSYNGTQGGSRDTHSDGDCWTESIGPSMYYAVGIQQHTGDNTWLRQMYNLCVNMIDEVPEPITPGVTILSSLYDGQDVDLLTTDLPSVDLGELGNQFPNIKIDLGELP